MKRLVGVIPAAGWGERLKSYPLPKELYSIGSMEIGAGIRAPKPIAQYIYEQIARCKPSRIYFVLGANKNYLMQYFENGRRSHVPTGYLFQERPTGLAMALYEARNFIGNETILFGMPDTYVEPEDSFVRLLEVHRRKHADITLGLFYVDDPSKFGCVECKGNEIVSISDKPEKPRSNWVWGIIICERTIFDIIPRLTTTRGEYQLTDAFQLSLEMGLKVIGHKFRGGRYFDIGWYDDALSLRRYLEDGKSLELG